MTKLVPVRVVCDDCRTAEARVYCVSLRRALCTACSESQQPHSRLVDLASTVTALPFCQRCDDAPASTYCAARGHTLCHNCDEADCSAARSQGSGKRDIVTALTQRSVRFTSSRPTTSSSATPPLSLERPEPMPPGTEVGGPLRRRAAEQAAAMNAGNAGRKTSHMNGLTTSVLEQVLTRSPSHKRQTGAACRSNSTCTLLTASSSY
jgi:hypothetical protein